MMTANSMDKVPHGRRYADVRFSIVIYGSICRRPCRTIFQRLTRISATGALPDSPFRGCPALQCHSTWVQSFGGLEDWEDDPRRNRPNLIHVKRERWEWGAAGLLPPA